MSGETEEPRDKAWTNLKQESAFQGGLGRERMVELFGFIDELRSDNKRLKADVERLWVAVNENKDDLRYVKTAFDGDRLLGPGIFERLDKTQESLDAQQKAIEHMSRKVDEGAVISQQNQALSKQLSLQLKLLILVFVLLFILLLFYVVAIYV